MDEKDKVIKKLQTTIFVMAGFHGSDEHPESETCIYCGTPWPCTTVRMARKSATLWSFD